MEHTLVVLRTTHMNKKIMRRKVGNSTVKYGLRYDGGMMETLVLGIGIIGVYLAILVQIRMMNFALARSVEELDRRLAEAIQNTVQNLPIGDIEPVNPVQMMIMQLIQDNMAKNPAKVIPRDEKGLFTADNTE